MDSAAEILKNRKINRERLEKEAPDLFNGFNGFMKSYYKEGALNLKKKS